MKSGSLYWQRRPFDRLLVANESSSNCRTIFVSPPSKPSPNVALVFTGVFELRSRSTRSDCGAVVASNCSPASRTEKVAK